MVKMKTMTAHPAINEVVSPMRATAEDLEWTIERLTTLAAGDRTDELVRVLKRSVAPQQAAAPTEEPTLRRSPGELSSVDEP
jgi:phosphoenolpyruvate carboxylase